jgi:sugar/nucleoside kinase (ribokinase family)
MVFIDTKKELGNWIINATYIKLNQYEYKNNRAFIKGNPEMFADKLLITYGEKGCYYQNKLYKPEIFAEVKDVCGAGDTFLSAFAVKRVKGASVNSAIKFAQKCASDVVSKRGVVTI